jgi:hypothetical protein
MSLITLTYALFFNVLPCLYLILSLSSCMVSYIHTNLHTYILYTHIDYTFSLFVHGIIYTYIQTYKHTYFTHILIILSLTTCMVSYIHIIYTHAYNGTDMSKYTHIKRRELNDRQFIA